MKRFGQKVSASILLSLAVGSVPTIAHAVKVEFFVNNVLVHQTIDVATPLSTAAICTVAPCTGINGKVVTVPIAAGTFGGLQILAGARGEAKIETNATTINASATINNTLNVVGTFRMLVPGELRIVTSSDFNLRQGTTTTLSGGGTWQALGRGASKCEKTLSTGPYQNSFCVISDASVDSANSGNDCTLCRSYGFTDTGHVLRPQLVGGSTVWQLPASGVAVTMTSDVQFKNTAGTVIRTEPIGAQSQIGPYTIPGGSLPENGRFYINLSQNELVPCEPFAEPCQNSERKSSTLRFTNMLANDQAVLPATSTDVGTSEFGVLQAQLEKVEIPIDLQPIDPVPDPNNPGFFLPGVNNDSGQGNSQGNLQVLALATPAVNTCLIVPFDGQTPLAKLTVAGSDPVAFTRVDQHSVDGVCIGLRFTFDRGAINDTIPGETDAEKLQATCQSDCNLAHRRGCYGADPYSVVPTQGSGKKGSYEPGPNAR